MIFVELLKSEICGTAIPASIVEQITPEMLPEIYSIAARHDLTHMIGKALKENRILEQVPSLQIFRQGMHAAVFRYENMQYDMNQICQVLEEAQIVYVPLKGAVIRDYYPQPWMRTSSDIDILVPQADLEKAKEILAERLHYKVHKYNYHDITLVSEQGNVLELHFQMLENEENIDKLLGCVWDYVVPVEEGKYRYAMTPEYFIFHTVAHMLYHFIHGGCGVRFLMDVWLLEQKTHYDRKVLKHFYKECGIERFAWYVEKLTRVWFEGEKHDAVSKQMQEYIIEGGLFGTTETKVRAGKTRIEGNLKYLAMRIFQPFDDVKMLHPEIEKYPVLYPYYVVKRWFRILDKNVAGHARQEIQVNAKMQHDSVEELKNLFRQLKI